MSKYQELYKWYKSIGICPQCRANKAAPNRVRCEECLAKNTESAEKSRKRRRKNSKENFKRYLKDMRSERKEKGLCIWCGKPVCSSSTIHCIDCKTKAKKRGSKPGISRTERPDYGLCYICGKPIDRKGKLCKKCAETARNNLPEHTEIMAWRHDNDFIFAKKG